jgi:hypothetical protein
MYKKGPTKDPDQKEEDIQKKKEKEKVYCTYPFL